MRSYLQKVQTLKYILGGYLLAMTRGVDGLLALNERQFLICLQANRVEDVYHSEEKKQF